MSKTCLCKYYCVLSERTRLKLECWVPYTIPYLMLYVPRKPASHHSVWLLHVLLPSRVGLLGTAALAPPRRPDDLVPAPGIAFHPSPTANARCSLSHSLCQRLLHARFVHDTSNMTIQAAVLAATLQICQVTETLKTTL